jgi:DNA-binding response OmpR family regulator
VVLKDGMDGLQLFKEIRAKKEFSKLPIAVQSKKPAMKEAFKNLGAQTFFAKPYSMDIFLGEINDILTKKALILGDEESTVKPICKILSDNDFQVDILNNPYKFYVNITSYRYSLVVVQSKIRATLADMSISLLRESQKNSKVPVIVYVAAKDSETAKKEALQETTLKEKCEKLGGCEFMDKGYSNKQFLEISKKYLESN